LAYSLTYEPPPYRPDSIGRRATWELGVDLLEEWHETKVVAFAAFETQDPL
jgi:hypothetical protein